MGRRLGPPGRSGCRSRSSMVGARPRLVLLVLLVPPAAPAAAGSAGRVRRVASRRIASLRAVLCQSLAPDITLTLTLTHTHTAGQGSSRTRSSPHSTALRHAKPRRARLQSSGVFLADATLQLCTASSSLPLAAASCPVLSCPVLRARPLRCTSSLHLHLTPLVWIWTHDSRLTPRVFSICRAARSGRQWTGSWRRQRGCRPSTSSRVLRWAGRVRGGV